MNLWRRLTGSHLALPAHALLAALALVAASCGGTTPGGSPDSGSPDSGSPDSGSPDSGSPDSGSPDSGSPDSGSPDAGGPVGLFNGFTSNGINSLTVVGQNLYWIDGHGSSAAAIKSVPTSGGAVSTLLAEPMLDQDLATDGTHLFFIWESSPSSTPLPQSSLDSVALDGTGRRTVTSGFSTSGFQGSNPASELFYSGGQLYFPVTTIAQGGALPAIVSIDATSGASTTVYPGDPVRQVRDLAWADSSGIYFSIYDLTGSQFAYKLCWLAAGASSTPVVLYQTTDLASDSSWARSLAVVNGSAWFYAGGFWKWTQPDGPPYLVNPWSGVTQAGLLADAQGMYLFPVGSNPGFLTVDPGSGAQVLVDHAGGNIDIRMTALDANNVYYGTGSASNHNLQIIARPRPPPPAPSAATPVFNPPGGNYQPGGAFHPIQDVVITSSSGAVIHYTIDGSTPTGSSPTYSAPIHINATTTLTAYAQLSGAADSPVASATYHIPTTAAATPTFSPPAGTYTSNQSVTLASATAGATIFYTSDGSTPTTASTSVASGAIVQVTASGMLKAIAISTTTLASTVASAAYTIVTNATPADAPTFNPPHGTYSTAQDVTLASTTSGASIYYTVDGNTPDTGTTLYTAPVHVAATETIRAIAIATGHTTSTEADATYTINTALTPAAAPTFSPAAGTYSSTQTVTISTTTSGATLYYTTDGSTPDTNSTVYSAPLSVPASVTLKAIASGGGHSASAVASAAYVILTPTSAPTFSPGAGTYTSAQSVTITSATSGAAVYYTSDGSTPTSGSTPYTTPVQVSASVTLKAIATATGHLDSSVSTAAYVISSGGATDFPTVCAEIFTVVHQLFTSCEEWNPALFTSAGYLAANDCAVIAGEITAGRVTYDGAKGASCASAVSAFTCADLSGDLPASCQAMTTGTIGDGSDCYVTADCATGTCTSSSYSCPGTCQPLATEGQPCGAGCASGLVCDYSGFPVVCVTPSSTVGGNCPCAGGLWCDGSGASPVCQASLQPGAPCSPPSLGGDQPCGTGYLCAGASPTCLALVGQGGDCTADVALCGAGYNCISNACASWPGVSQPCSSFYSQCLGGYCNLSTASPVCVAYVADGGSCDPGLSGQDCASGYCDSGTSKCGPTVCGP